MTETSFTAGLVQMRSGRDPEANLTEACRLIGEAADGGATLIATPEMTSLLENKSRDLFAKVKDEVDSEALPMFRSLASQRGLWLVIGSLPIKVSDDKVANRSYLIGPDGEVAAHYGKIHMFDVDLEGGESYRESRNYEPGKRAVCADTSLGRIGLSVCYDLRFPHLYRTLAKAGADILTVPAAFTRKTGAAHWHVLLRARAIETGCYVLAPAQGGVHECGRETYGHSLAVSPWGEIVAEIDGEEPGVTTFEIDLAAVQAARQAVPSLTHDRDWHLAEPGA